MKIVCDACQAKYSISDDKVIGKVFKIRCKKCSNVIVVKGGAGAAEAPAPEPQKETRVYDYGSEGGGGEQAVWHVVVNQDQVGPLTIAEVQSRYAAGEIDAETYAWQEGFADWLPLSQIDAFSSLTASGTTKSDSADLFTTSSTPARGATDDEADLFGGAPSRGTGGGAASDSKLRGERNENSVLFSLGNLAKIANDKPAPNAGVTSTPSGHAMSASGGEGSGLIDIRSMANAYLGSSGGAAKPAISAGVGSLDDLPVFGGAAFSEPAVVMPMASRPANSNKVMYALIGSVGVLAIAAVIIVVVLLNGGKEPPPAVQVASNDPVKTDEPVKDEAKTDVPTPVEKKPDEPPPVAAKPDEPPPTTAKDTKPATKKDSKTTTHVASKTATSPAEKAPAEKAPVEKAPVVAKTDCDEVSCLLNPEGACCSKPKQNKVTTKPPVGGEAPDALDRTMITDGMNKVKAKAMACGSKSAAKGQVKVSVKVNPGGDVASVTVKASPDEALGNCVASTVQKARFAKTVNGGSFSFPFGF